MLLRVAVELDGNVLSVTSYNYTIMSLLRDFAGIFELLLVIFGFFLLPVSEYSFNMWAGRRLYFGSTTDQKVFDRSGKYPESTQRKEYSYELTPEENDRVGTHFVVKLDCCSHFWLFLNDKFKCILKNCCYNCMMGKYEKLERYHDKARDKMSKEFNMIRLLKFMRASRALVHNSFLDRRMKYKIDHSH